MSSSSQASFESSSIFADFVNVISGARQSATQEFAQFWEIIGQPSFPDNKRKPDVTTTKIRKKIFKPDLPLSSNGIIYDRIMPDPTCKRRRIIQDAEIQTEPPTSKRKCCDDTPPVERLKRQCHIDQTTKAEQKPMFKIKNAFTPETPSLSLLQKSSGLGYVRKKVRIGQLFFLIC